MPHFVNKLYDGGYQTSRKRTGPVYQTSTPTEGVPIEDARVFSTKGAATTSLNAAGLDGEVIPVTITPTSI